MAERTLHTPLTDLPGVGPARARALDKLGLSTVADLLAYFPREYEDRTVREGIAWLPAGSGPFGRRRWGRRSASPPLRRSALSSPTSARGWS